jgi:hypothetical protein
MSIKRVKMVTGTIALAAALSVASSTTASAAPAAMPSVAGPPAFVPGPAATICTPSWGSIVLPFCV